MKSVVCKSLWLIVGAGANAWLCVPAFSQTSNALPADAASQAVAKITPPPASPAAKSPVDFFRELLAMNGAERQQVLTNRPPEVQKLILAKVREYELMRANVRELRLRSTELHYYLLPLMRLTPAERTPQLANMPEEDRRLVEERLRQWDKLPAATQKELLDNYATIRWLEGGTEPPRPDASVPPVLEPGLRRWQSLPGEQQQAIMQRFRRVFDLTSEEREHIFRILSEPERKQIEKTLNQFARLSAPQRAQCLESFQKFANLAPEERQQFLRTAERWKLLTPDQRQAWRDLVTKLPPPLPGSSTPPPLPHRAAVLAPGPGSAPVATNSN